MTDFSEYHPHGQPQDVDRDFGVTLESACNRFFEHAKANATYSDQLAEAYADIDTLDLTDKQRRDARRLARDRIQDDESLEPKPASMAIILPPGTGKTTAARRAFSKVRPGASDAYFPTVKLCVDFAKAFNDDAECKGTYAIVEKPRGGEDDGYSLIDKSLFTDEDQAAEVHAKSKGLAGYNCPKIVRSDVLSDAGASVRSTLCAGCALRKSCGYWRQERELIDARAAGAMMVRPHARLWTGSLVDKSNIKVVDEALIESCIKYITFTLDSLKPEIASAIMSFSIENAHHVDALYSVYDMVHSFQTFPDRPVSDVILDIRPVRSIILFLMNKSKDIEKNLKAHQGTAAELEARVKASGLKFINDLTVLCRQLAAAWKHKCPMDTMLIDNSNLVVTHIHLPDIKKHDNLLILDASFRGNFSKIIFPDRDFEMVSGDEVDLNVDIEWVDISASTMSLEGPAAAPKRNRELVRDQVRQSIGSNVLVVSNKKVLKSLQKDGLPKGWHVANFGALRGKNDWKDVDGVAIVGRSMPDVAMIERQCAAYSLAAGRGPVQTVERYRRAMGIEGGVSSLLPMDEENRYFHPCEFVWDFIKAKVHDEYIQAIGRCRSIRSERRKKVLIISKFMPPELEEYVVKSVENADLSNLNAWHQCLILDILTQGWCLLSPSFLNHKYSKYGANGGVLSKRKMASTREIDVDLIRLALSNGVVTPPYSINPNLLKNNIVANFIGEIEEGGINLLDKIKEGTPSIYNILIGNVPSSISMADVVWGEKQKPSTLLTVPGTDLEFLKIEIPRLKIVDDKTGRARHMPVLVTQDEGAIATKTFRQKPTGLYQEVREYQAGTYFSLGGGDVADIDDLAAKLTQIEKYPNCFVIRGQHIEGMSKPIVRRTVRTRKEARPFFEDAPRSWIMLDVDEYRLPYGSEDMAHEGGNPAGVAYYLRNSLPEPFRDARCFIQMSASCWLKGRDVFKAHVWFMMDSALTSSQCKLWIKSIGERIGKTTMYRLGEGHCIVDTSVLAPVQPHFTAAPIIENGPPPFEKRSWIMPGRVDTVECKLPEVKLAQRTPKSTIGRTEASPATVKFRFNSSLGEIGEGQRGFNEGVKHAAMYAAMVVCNRITPQEELVERIAQAVMDADSGNREAEEIERYASDEFINDKIEWWLDVMD